MSLTGPHTARSLPIPPPKDHESFSSVKLNAKLEGRTLTLTELAAPKGEGAFMEVDGVYQKVDDPSVTEIPDKAILVLERK